MGATWPASDVEPSQDVMTTDDVAAELGAPSRRDRTVNLVRKSARPLAPTPYGSGNPRQCGTRGRHRRRAGRGRGVAALCGARRHATRPRA